MEFGTLLALCSLTFIVLYSLDRVTKAIEQLTEHVADISARQEAQVPPMTSEEKRCA